HALIIDDSRVMRMVLKQILQATGFEVAEAANGLEGLECLQRSGPMDLALVDWNMPLMDGIEFVRAVRANPKYDRQRLMMVTTEAGEDYRRTAFAAGADAYVVKPFKAQAIREKI